jgi:uncharacterized membrane protein YheB (UPF0754 family)
MNIELSYLIGPLSGNRINELDIEEGEKIIFAVMDKELRAIVWLGALLGGIIGMVNSLF